MGVYNTYEGVQLKIGRCELKEYKLGDKVDIPDGIYVGYEGVVVIADKMLVAQYEKIFDKWGGVISCDSAINGHNQITKALENLEDVKCVEYYTIKCPACNGAGYVNPTQSVSSSSKVLCSNCNGDKRITVTKVRYKNG